MSDSYMQGNADNAIQVPFSDDESVKDEELITDDDSPSASPEERVTRKKKRQERITRLLNEGKQSKEELASLKAEQGELKGELERLKGYVAANQNAARREAPGDGKDDYQRRLDAVYEKQGNAYAAAQAEIKAGTFDDKRSRYYEGVAREIEEEKSSIHAERVLARREPAVRQEQAQQVWVQKYPDVYREPRAFQFAKATFERRLALGDANTPELVDEVMGETMVQFRLGPKKAPTANDRARLSGLPSSGSGGGGSRDPSGITMTPELRRMAIAAYDHLPEAEAIKAWTNKAGKRLREKKIL